MSTGSATSCTATVTDEAASSPSVPTGGVTFSPVPATGSFSASGSCTLAAAGATSASCVITYTATEGGDYTLSADYAGDSGHHASIGTTTVTAIDPTATSFTCDTSNPPINTSATCTATITDAGAPQAPTGEVTYTSDQSAGSFAAPGQCPWTPAVSGMGGTATCQVVFSATTAGTYTLAASYGGDRTHAASAGTTQLIVTTVATGGGPGASNPGGLSVPVGSSPPTGPVLLPGTIRIAAGTATVSTRHAAGVRLACSGSRGAQCTGILTLTAPITVKVKVKEKVKEKEKVKVKSQAPEAQEDADQDSDENANEDGDRDRGCAARERRLHGARTGDPRGVGGSVQTCIDATRAGSRPETEGERVGGWRGPEARPYPGS